VSAAPVNKAGAEVVADPTAEPVTMADEEGTERVGAEVAGTGIGTVSAVAASEITVDEKESGPAEDGATERR